MHLGKENDAYLSGFDDTITYSMDFFVRICECFADARITIVTFRTDFESAEGFLNANRIRFDQLIVSSDRENGKVAGEPLCHWKARMVNQLKPDLFFEDMPEVISRIDDCIVVFMACDSVMRSWTKSKLDSPETQ